MHNHNDEIKKFQYGHILLVWPLIKKFIVKSLFHRFIPKQPNAYFSVAPLQCENFLSSSIANSIIKSCIAESCFRWFYYQYAILYKWIMFRVIFNNKAFACFLISEPCKKSTIKKIKTKGSNTSILQFLILSRPISIN